MPKTLIWSPRRCRAQQPSHTHTHAHILPYIHTLTDAYTRSHSHTHTHLHTPTHTPIFTHTHSDMLLHTYTHTHTHTHILLHAHTHIPTHTRTCHCVTSPGQPISLFRPQFPHLKVNADAMYEPGLYLTCLCQWPSAQSCSTVLVKVGWTHPPHACPLTEVSHSVYTAYFTRIL